MTRCYVSEQIAIHCSQPEQEIFGCWHCGEEVEEDSLTEVKTKYAGHQFISDCCIDEYMTGEV